MNLSEAITFVLRKRSPNLLQDFLREDLSSVIGGVIADGSRLFREGREGIKSVRIKNLPGELLDTASEISQLITVLPRRIRKALKGFQEDMLAELESIGEPKDKVYFCLKVFGILSSSTFVTFYNLKNSRQSLTLGKVKLRSAFAQFLLAELVLRSLRLFALRFIAEVEQKVSAQEDLDHLRYFRKILEGDIVAPETPVSPEDPAFRVTEKLKKIILNGDDES